MPPDNGSTWRSAIRRYRWPILAVCAAGLIFVAVWFEPQKLFIDDVVAEELPQVAPSGTSGSSEPPGSTESPGSDGSGQLDEPESDADPLTEPPEGSVPANETGSSSEAAGDSPPGPTAPESTEPATPPQTEPATPQIVDLAQGDFQSLGRYSTTGSVRIVELDDGRRFVRLEDFETSNGPDLFVYLSSGSADGSEGFTDDYVDLGVLKGNIGAQNYEIGPEVELDAYTSVVIYCRRFSSPFGAAQLQAAST